MINIYLFFLFLLLNGSFKVAGSGNVQEFERIIRDDLSKLKVTNKAGLCAAHNAAARNRIAILALIAQYNGGKIMILSN